MDRRGIPLGESAEFLRKAIRGLMTRWGIADLSVLALDRFRLRDEIEEAPSSTGLLKPRPHSKSFCPSRPWP